MMLSSLNYISTGGIQHVLSPWMALRHCGCFWAQTEKAQEERLRDARGLLLVPTKLLLVPTIIQKFQIYSRPRYTMESCIHCIMEVRKLLFNGISIPLYSKQQNLDFVVFFFFATPCTTWFSCASWFMEKLYIRITILLWYSLRHTTESYFHCVFFCFKKYTIEIRFYCASR